MKHDDTIMPYILASMHPLMHLSLLTAGSMLRFVDNEKFYDIPNAATCKSGQKALEFIDFGGEWYMNYITLAHAIAIISHYLSEYFSTRNKLITGTFMIVKIFTYFFTHYVVQSGIVFEECRDGIIDESQVMAWLSYEVIAFYLNIIAMGVFILFSSCKKFYTIRDRIGLAGDRRKNQDYLNYIKEDIHWFCMWFTMLMLTVLALVMRTRSHESIQKSVGVLFTRHFLELILMASFYYSKDFALGTAFKAIIGCILLINFFLIIVFLELEKEFTVWWGPVVLLDVTLHFFMFFQIGYMYKTWDTIKLEWKKDLMLQELLELPENVDADEDKLKYKVETMILTGEDNGAQKPLLVGGINNEKSSDNDQVAAKEKTMKVSANMYTICYFGFMRTNKEKFKLKVNDQMDILYRAIFLFVIQMTFIGCILTMDTFDLTFKNNLAVNLCLFFTVLILHWQCIGQARNGIYMMKYAICNPEEFNNPHVAFILGFMQIISIVLTEICNLLKSSDQKNPQSVIAKFVGFGLILSVPTLLHGSMEGFQVSSAVGKLVLKKSRKNVVAQQGGMTFGWVLNLVYCLFKWFFISFYYYFFPFIVIFVPLIKITYLYNLNN